MSLTSQDPVSRTKDLGVAGGTLQSRVQSPRRIEAAEVLVAQGQEGPRTFTVCGVWPRFRIWTDLRLGGQRDQGRAWNLAAAAASMDPVPGLECLGWGNGCNSVPTQMPSPCLSRPVLSTATPAETAPPTTPISGEFPGPKEGQGWGGGAGPPCRLL